LTALDDVFSNVDQVVTDLSDTLTELNPDFEGLAEADASLLLSTLEAQSFLGAQLDEDGQLVVSSITVFTTFVAAEAQFGLDPIADLGFFLAAVHMELEVQKDVTSAAIANDPPDPDYQQVFVPVPILAEPLPPTGLSPALLTAAQSALTDIDQATQWMYSVDVTENRYATALAAGDTNAASMQFVAFLNYLSLYISAAQAATTDIANLSSEFQANDIGTQVVTAQDLTTALDTAQTQGTSGVSSLLESLGFTDTEIQTMEQEVEAETIPSSLPSETADLALNNLASSFGSVTPNPSPPADTTADMIMHNGTNGDYEIYDIGSNAILAAYPLVPVGLESQIAGLGGFNGSDTTDMMMRVSNTGAFEVYDISNNQITWYASLGQVGLEWAVAGFGDFSSNAGETDMLMRNSNTGAFEVYDVSNNQITFAAGMGQVGLEWTVAGFGDFSGNANETDLLMRDSSTGEFAIYDISKNNISGYATFGPIGLEWTVAGFGDFSGNANETDMLMRNSSTGAFEVYDISHNALTFAGSMGAVGLEWTVAGIAADPPSAVTAQLVHAMASFGGSAVVSSATGAILSGADTSQQPLLTIPH
jgi:hypothetical protein